MSTMLVAALWVVAQIVAGSWVFLLRRSHNAARVGLVLLFLWAGFVNWTTARDHPEAYLDYARFAWLDFYASFIEGWFATHVRPFVGTIAVLQIVLAGLLASRGLAARIGLAGAITFFVGITPLGIGAGFPFPVVLAFGCHRLLESVDDSIPAMVSAQFRLGLGRALLAWTGLFGLAFVNGAFRELLLTRFLTAQAAQHVSALSACLLFAALVFGVWDRLRITSASRAVKIGAIWATLTILTESLILGRWLGGRSWREILETYDVMGGKSWPLVVLWILALPPLAYALRPAAKRQIAQDGARSR